MNGCRATLTTEFENTRCSDFKMKKKLKLLLESHLRKRNEAAEDKISHFHVKNFS
jgi:hypothetical protein